MKLGWIFYFFFIALLSSQSLMDLGSTLMAISVLLVWWQKRKLGEKLPVPHLGLEKVFLAWLVIILLGLLASRQPDTPWLKSFLEFRWILEFYIYITALNVLQPTEKNIRQLLPVVWVTAIYTLLCYFLKFDLLHQGWADREAQLLLDQNHIWYRAGGLFMNPMPYAHTYGTLAALMMGPLFYFQRGEWLKNKFWIFGLGLTLLGIVFSFTRGIWLGLAVACLMMASFINWKKGLGVLGALILIAAGLFLSVREVRERILFSFDPATSYDSERLIIWKTNWLIFSENPILGLGYGENGRRLREYFDRLNVPKGFLESHAHNQYLHFLAGTGILGLLCFVLVIGFLFRMHFQAFRGFSSSQEPFWKGLALGVLGAEITFYVAGVTESNFSIAKNRYFILLVWALGCWLWYKMKNQRNVAAK
jgi:O-antigen ligase